jgi:endonuclease YncB( thermonuclease family)
MFVLVRSGLFDNPFMRRLSFIAIALALVVFTGVAAAQQYRDLVGTSFPARVAAVIDGDTIDVVRPSTPAKVRIRLDGIDSPESGEPYSQVARARTRVLAFDRQVIVNGKDVDRYGRLVARVIVSDAGAPKDLSVTLVAEGLACHYLQYSSDPVLASAEADARAAGRGFWAAGAPKPACVTRPAPAAGAVAQPSTSTPRPLSSGRGASVKTGAGASVVFHGNTRSKVFHAPTCRNYNCPNCTRQFRSREEAVAAGFRPAGDCLRGHDHARD